MDAQTAMRSQTHRCCGGHPHVILVGWSFRFKSPVELLSWIHSDWQCIDVGVIMQLFRSLRWWHQPYQRLEVWGIQLLRSSCGLEVSGLGLQVGIIEWRLPKNLISESGINYWGWVQSLKCEHNLRSDIDVKDRSLHRGSLIETIDWIQSLRVDWSWNHSCRVEFQVERATEVGVWSSICRLQW